MDLLGYVHLQITASAQSGSRGGGHLLGSRAGRRPVGVLNVFIMASKSRFFIFVLPSTKVSFVQYPLALCGLSGLPSAPTAADFLSDRQNT